MKTAKEKFYSEKHALACKIIELHCGRAFDDHPSTVARHRERLDARAVRVVELEQDAERAEAEWEVERRQEAAERAQTAAEDHRAHVALLQDFLAASEHIEELHSELESACRQIGTNVMPYGQMWRLQGPRGRLWSPQRQPR